MKITEKLIKPVMETRYLTVDNADRYRSIIRLFYLNYEKLKYWLYQEEVYAELREDEYFSGYTPEQCQQDLKALTEWGNLLTMQDLKKVSTIEEFKNKKFRYQLSEYAVEIERMVVRLENLLVEGASLEPTLLERIRRNVARIPEMPGLPREEIYTWWTDLNNDFIRLNQNYQDYMRELNSVKAEEMMQTKEFLLFKDRLIDYLRSFVKGLQMNGGVIEKLLWQADKEALGVIFEEVTEYELAIPRLDVEIDRRQIMDKVTGRFESLRAWFVERDGHGAEAGKVFDTTNEIIRKITRYATRISEQSNVGANRREEYKKVAEIFGRCRSLGEAHRLSASVFGVEAPVHIRGGFVRRTESINSGVYDEEPFEVLIQPRVRTYKEKTARSSIQNYEAEKEEVKRREMERLLQERQLLSGFIVDGCLDFASLPVIRPQVRDTFLLWLSKALEHKSRRAKTEDGRVYEVREPENGETCMLECTDGTFLMPAYRLFFEE